MRILDSNAKLLPNKIMSIYTDFKLVQIKDISVNDKMLTKWKQNNFHNETSE